MNENDKINKNIGIRIKNRRLELNMTQSELAEKLNLKNRSTVTRYEQGEKSFKQSQIISLAQALSTTPAYLMGWDDEEVAKDNLEYLKKLLEEYDLTLNDFTEQEIRKIVEYSLFLNEQRNRGGSNV